MGIFTNRTAPKQAPKEIVPKNSPGSLRELIDTSLGVIGRSNVGKTALFNALNESICNENLPSGLQFAVGSAKGEARALKDMLEKQKMVRERALDSTMTMEANEFYLYEGAQKRIRFAFREVIGQILTNPEGDDTREAMFKEYQQTLTRADVIWVLVPCPPADAGADEDQKFMYDIRLAGAYLREALGCRINPRPCSVALVVSKTDTCFDTENDARESMTEVALTKALRSLVATAKNDPLVENVAIFPVSAFGFQNAVQKSVLDEHEDDLLANGERIWVLKPDRVQVPFNITPLVLWSLICGMMHQNLPDENDNSLVKVWQMLIEDFESMDSLYVPVKTRSRLF